MAVTTLATAEAPTVRHLDWAARIDEVLERRAARLVYQPIVDLQRRCVAGYEALARFDSAPVASPDRWFAAAAELGRVVELEALVTRTALDVLPHVPDDCFLTVNVEPEAMLSARWRHIVGESESLAGIVFELTEHRPADPHSLRDVLPELRAKGARIAIDDAGAGHSGLQQILAIRPDFLKLDASLVRDLDQDEAKTSLVEMLGTFADRVGAWLVAEGVESAEEAARLAQLGVPYVQGYHFGRPAEPWPACHFALDVVPDDEADHRRRRVRSIADPVSCVRTEERTRARELLLERRFVVVVDPSGRPTGLLDRRAWLEGEPLRPLVIRSDAPLVDLARRVATRPRHEVATPAVAVDRDGVVAGIVTVERLLVGLSACED